MEVCTPLLRSYLLFQSLCQKKSVFSIAFLYILFCLSTQLLFAGERKLDYKQAVMQIESENR